MGHPARVHARRPQRLLRAPGRAGPEGQERPAHGQRQHDVPGLRRHGPLSGRTPPRAGAGTDPSVPAPARTHCAERAAHRYPALGAG
ncbi:hypothetical protein SGPA1_40449 [Streptomyces misionensis JCM 4497]